jgi:hypothetical protein
MGTNGDGDGRPDRRLAQERAMTEHDTSESGAVDLIQRDIINLDRLADLLPPEEQDLFARLYLLGVSSAELSPPPTMHRWIERYFGGVDAVLHQRIVRVTNRVTLEGSLFNALRARRPIENRIPVQLDDEIARSEGGPFSSPLTGTPADVFGRIEGSHSVTASNIAKYDGFHGLVIFNQHHPLIFDEEAIADYLDVGRRWAELAHAEDASAIYYFFMWNCLWRSGASIPHGHAQVSLTRGMHYGKIEAYRRAIEGYRRRHEASYIDDLWRVHSALGLGHERHGCRVMLHLTPIKEKETLVVGRAVNADFARAIHEVLRCYIDQLGVVSFNLVVYQPPLAVETAPEDWSDFPVMARIVDRGDPINRTSDFGSMEIYASSVIASDPFRVADVLRAAPSLPAH